MHAEATSRWSGADVELFLLTPEHASDEYLSWMNDPAVNRYLESRFASHSIESIREFISQMYASTNTLFFGIRALSPRRHVGNIKIGPIDTRLGLGEIGIMIGDPAARGRGVGSAAIDLLAGIARVELGLRKLTAGCYASNAGSARAFSKAGFSVEGRRTAHYLLDGKPEDLILMARFL